MGHRHRLPLNSYTAWVIVRSHFDPVIHLFVNSTYDLGRLSVALGHVGLVMLLAKAGWLRWLMSGLGAIGQMALSNYVFQSVVTAFLFTGYGFALYGRLQRYQLYYVVAAIWVFQFIASPIWRRSFRFGPLEWGWRSLTYWQRQPMRLRGAAGSAAGSQSAVEGCQVAGAAPFGKRAGAIECDPRSGGAV